MNGRIHGLKQRLALPIVSQKKVFTPALGGLVAVLNAKQVDPALSIDRALPLQAFW